MFWSATAFVHYQLTLVVHLAGQSQHLFYCVVLTFNVHSLLSTAASTCTQGSRTGPNDGDRTRVALVKLLTLAG